MSGDDFETFELDPETSALLRKQFEIDYADAGQKAPVSGFEYKGVRIESRWAVLSELETMKNVIDAMPELMARRMAMIWCDSKAGANYVVSVRPGRWIADLKWDFSDAIMTVSSGHNGVYFEEGSKAFEGEELDHLDPDWGELEDDNYLP